jgi:putative membrane protein
MKKLLLPIAMGILFACNTGDRKDSVEAAEDANEQKSERTTESAPTTGPAPVVAEDDQEFVVKAASGGLMEVQLGQTAAQKANDPAVKEFAQRMVNDHGQVNNELKALAAQKNITIPATPGEDHQEDINKLGDKTGREFDRDYMKLMVEDHKDDVDKFEKAAKDCKDPDIKAFAAKHVAHLKGHLEQAQQIRDKIKR